MQRSDFYYELPRELIAHYPPARRGDSRLLHLHRTSGVLRDLRFSDLVYMLNPRDLLVFNDTRVIPARLYGRKESGGKVEILLERLLGDHDMLAQVKAGKSLREGTSIMLENKMSLEVTGRQEGFYLLRNKGPEKLLDIFNQSGHIPLPPYIDRTDDALDRDRYQTLFAREDGAVAAPTAGLHFSGEFLQAIADRGIRTAFITLHVGAGTFQPVRVDSIKNHRMHKERFRISAETCTAIQETRSQGGNIVAVGTTTVRALEAGVGPDGLFPQDTETDTFIYPGYRFRVIDAMITNFHLPESTLLMLVCALAGRENVMHAYAHAIREKYRFYSYGDAMFISN